MIKPNVYFLLWLLGAVLICEAFNLFPPSEELYSMFPFNDGVKIALQPWADYGFTRIAFSMILFAVFRYSTKYTEQLFLIWILSVIYVIDYFLTYNGHFHIGHINLRFTVIRIFAFICIIIKTINDEWT